MAEHRLVVEAALKRVLPMEHPVHHVNGKKADNRPANLVVCQDAGYHQLLHRRIRTKKACGNAGFFKCALCKKYDHPENMRAQFRNGYPRYRHRECDAKYARDKRAPHLLSQVEMSAVKSAAAAKGWIKRSRS